MSTAVSGPLRFGVIGCADIAVRRLLPAMGRHPMVELVAVASRDPAKAGAVAARFGCEPAGYRELLARDDVDAVYLPLPPALHAEWATAALRAGKHALVEKPLCTSRAEAVALVELASASGLAMVENFMFLHHSQHAGVARMLADGAVGQPRILSSSFGIPSVRRGSFRDDPGLGGGALLDVGVYPLRIAQLYLPVEWGVAGACLGVDAEAGTDVTGSVLLAGPGGESALLEFGVAHAYRSTCAVWGSRGRIGLSRAFTPPDEYQPVLRLEEQDRVTELVLPADRQVHNTLTAFARTVTSPELRRRAAESIVRQANLLERVCDLARGVRVASSCTGEVIAARSA